jgi:hypothetical protein
MLRGLHSACALWVNELGGFTVAYDGPAGGEFVKWAPHRDELDLRRDATRLRRAARFIRVPEVIESQTTLWSQRTGAPSPA